MIGSFRSRSAVLLVTTVTLSSFAHIPDSLAAPQSHNIVFRIFGPKNTIIPFGPGPGNLANISYRTQSTHIQDKLVPLPWHLTFQMAGDDAALARQLHLSATRTDPDEAADGIYSCEISVDGEVRVHEDSDTETGIVHCSLD